MSQFLNQPVLKSNRWNNVSRRQPPTYVAARRSSRRALALMLALVIGEAHAVVQHPAFSRNSWLLLANLGWVLHGLCDATTWR